MSPVEIQKTFLFVLAFTVFLQQLGLTLQAEKLQATAKNLTTAEQ
jgi:hypothetical protein